ncbi:MAG: aminopeptidase P family protein [Bdellovibrionales bacterium]|nr:aminopeptidase P family protein [Bdellovibrionales bacterium]
MIPLLFPKSVYAKRREQVARHLEPSRDLAVFFNAPEKIRNDDAHYGYRPDSHFIYLTGFAEPGSACLIWRERQKGRIVTRFEILVLPRDAVREQWDGYRYGTTRARSLVGADAAYTHEELGHRILDWLTNQTAPGPGPRVYTNAFAEAEHKEFLLKVLERFRPRLRSGRHALEAIGDATIWVQDQRRIKDEGELKVMRRSSEINVAGHLKLMHKLRPGMTEYEARGILEGEYMRLGALDVAYGTIAAAGANATILHYRAAHEVCKKGDLLLVDAGCEYNFYASDITRTLPVDGTYSREQRLIMDLVMEAHQEAMAQARPGRRYTEMHRAASETLKEGLRKLKLLPKGVPHTRYFPHGTGHWLGLDVHDPCRYVDDKGDSLRLQPGMIMTIEPGIYFMPNDRTVPKEFRGIGVRIEDDVVITKGKPENLTADLPRTASEIEREMKSAR